MYCKVSQAFKSYIKVQSSYKLTTSMFQACKSLAILCYRQAFHKPAVSCFVEENLYLYCNKRASVVKWFRLELCYEKLQVPSPLYLSYCFRRNQAPHYTNVLALCWCLVSNSRVYCILSTIFKIIKIVENISVFRL